jgi:nucleoside transporter
MKLSTRLQLSTMMFIQFFIWGLWFVTLGTYLLKNIGAKDVEVGLAFGTQSWGAIIAPFFIGLIADKYFAAQKVLGVLHLLGAATMFYVSKQTNFTQFYPFIFLYMALYMPTLGLVNAVALKQMRNAEKEFSLIRVWGTVGWIAAGLLVAYLDLEKNGRLVNTFTYSAICSLVLGLYSFALPNTPPTKKQGKVSFADIVGLDSLMLLKDKNYLVFFIASMLICIPLAFYYQQTNVFLNEIGVEKAAGKMSLGQMSETLFLFLMPLFFIRFSIKNMLLFGMLAWVLRYLCFAYGNADSGVWLLYLGIILHGICYDFFFVTGQIYTDKKAGAAIRSSAQGMITLATYGVGMMVGFWLAGLVAQQHAITGGGHNWQQIWLIPAGIAAVIVVGFLLIFNDKKVTA